MTQDTESEKADFSFQTSMAFYKQYNIELKRPIFPSKLPWHFTNNKSTTFIYIVYQGTVSWQ